MCKRLNFRAHNMPRDVRGGTLGRKKEEDGGARVGGGKDANAVSRWRYVTVPDSLDCAPGTGSSSKRGGKRDVKVRQRRAREGATDCQHVRTNRTSSGGSFPQM